MKWPWMLLHPNSIHRVICPLMREVTRGWFGITNFVAFTEWHHKWLAWPIHFCQQWQTKAESIPLFSSLSVSLHDRCALHATKSSTNDIFNHLYSLHNLYASSCTQIYKLSHFLALQNEFAQQSWRDEVNLEPCTLSLTWNARSTGVLTHQLGLLTARWMSGRWFNRPSNLHFEDTPLNLVPCSGNVQR